MNTGREIPTKHDSPSERVKKRSNRVASLLAMIGILLSQLSRITGEVGIVFLCLAIAVVVAAIVVFVRGLIRARHVSRSQAAT